MGGISEQGGLGTLTSCRIRSEGACNLIALAPSAAATRPSADSETPPTSALPRRLAHESRAAGQQVRAVRVPQRVKARALRELEAAE